MRKFYEESRIRKGTKTILTFNVEFVHVYFLNIDDEYQNCYDIEMHLRVYI